MSGWPYMSRLVEPPQRVRPLRRGRRAWWSASFCIKEMKAEDRPLRVGQIGVECVVLLFVYTKGEMATDGKTRGQNSGTAIFRQRREKRSLAPL
jgi:hypothetical protein